MAIKKCKECGKEISNQAKTCPHCGVSAPGKAKKRMIVLLLVFFLLLWLAGIQGSKTPASKSTSTPLPPVQKQTKPPKTANELRVDELSKCFSGWDGSHIELTKLIKKSMKNPKSYDHIDTIYIDKGDRLIVTTKYRGTNSFGAVVPESITAETDMDCNIIKIIQ